MNANDWTLITGSSNRSLAEKVSQRLDKPLAEAEIRRFSDGEVFVEIKENVRGKDCYVLQSTCPPVNDNLMELLVIVDALRRASVNDITTVIPYYGYARQDRKVAPRTPISAKLVANLLAAGGVSRVIAMDLHAGQIQGFFDIPSDNIFAMPVMLDNLKRQFGEGEDLVIVSPDAGGMERARAYAKRLESSVAMIDKRRTGPNAAKAMRIIGEVKGKTAIILDDMVDTAGTLCEAASAVMKQGAKSVIASATHGILSGPAIERIEASEIQKLFITDTVPLSTSAKECKKIEQVSVSDVIATAISRVRNCDSLSSLFV